ALAFPLAILGVWNIIYGALAAMAQTDFKRLVAYSSISHMGYVILGIAIWTTAGDGQYWKMGMNGAMYQMIAHGLSSAGMFFMVGVLYDRVHHRELDKFGGIAAQMPLYSGLAFGIFFAGMGLPGLCGFIGEIFVVLGAFEYSVPLAVIAAAGVILTAGYILWTLQRVYLGSEYRGPHPEGITVPIRVREICTAAPLLVFAIVLGVYPRALLSFMQPAIDSLVSNLAAWSQAAETATALIAR
ncbi:MAG: complex I subunit 4 family protein, partial [Pirellulales bacterium]